MSYIDDTFVGVIVCRGYRHSWSFPKEVAALLQVETDGDSVLHLFGGKATWGTRLDVDRAPDPDVIGNALFPPFRCESFDHVILDPPYKPANGVTPIILTPAACLARKRVWWLHTHSFGRGYHGLKLKRWWAVVPSEHAHLRILAELERTRHPRTCHPHPRTGRTRFPRELERWNWSREIEQHPLPMGVA